MRALVYLPVLLLLGAPGATAFLRDAAAALVVEPDAELADADRAAVLRAAGATLRDGKWVLCAPPPDAGALPPAGTEIGPVRDLNGDGRPEAVVTDSGSYCYGHAGMGFKLLSRQADGSWRLMTEATGMPEFLKTRGVGGWPDMTVGGPGFCFPVYRWNGRAYALHRHEYEGRRCKPRR